jgi:hypothetical protein
MIALWDTTASGKIIGVIKPPAAIKHLRRVTSTIRNPIYKPLKGHFLPSLSPP